MPLSRLLRQGIQGRRASNVWFVQWKVSRRGCALFLCRHSMLRPAWHGRDMQKQLPTMQNCNCIVSCGTIVSLGPSIFATSRWSCSPDTLWQLVSRIMWCWHLCVNMMQNLCCLGGRLRWGRHLQWVLYRRASLSVCRFPKRWPCYAALRQMALLYRLWRYCYVHLLPALWRWMVPCSGAVLRRLCFSWQGSSKIRSRHTWMALSLRLVC